MKKLFLAIIMLLTANTLMSQTTDTITYPIIKTDEFGKKVVVFTLEQANKIDNKLEILSIMEQTNAHFLQYDLTSIKLLEEKEQIINMLDKQIVELNGLVSLKNAQIQNLREQTLNNTNIEVLLKKEIENKNTEINLHLSKIKKLERNFFISGAVAAVLGTILIIK